VVAVDYLTKTICGALVVSLLVACGGGPTPSVLATPRIVVAIQRPAKRLVYKNDRLNLVKQIVPIEGDSYVIAGNQLVCMVQRSGVLFGCVDLPVDLWELDLLADGSRVPNLIVGNGGWGRPSVAVVDLKDGLKWKFDGGYDVMDKPLVVEFNDTAVVLVGNRAFDLRSGRPVNTQLCKCGAVASADFDQDGKRDLLRRLPSGGLTIVNGSGRELAQLPKVYESWDEPLVAGLAAPFVVLSRNEELEVYDRQLKPQRKLRTPGARLPLHAAAAAFLVSEFRGPFAVLVKGRGGWHRTILFVYAADDQLLYEEILDDDYQSMTPYIAADGTLAFLIGGRGEVWSYEFHR
jgi:hypothetical protein